MTFYFSKWVTYSAACLIMTSAGLVRHAAECSASGMLLPGHTEVTCAGLHLLGLLRAAQDQVSLLPDAAGRSWNRRQHRR